MSREEVPLLTTTPSAASSSSCRSIRLVHHGAAASSNNHVLTWLSGPSPTTASNNNKTEEEGVNDDTRASKNNSRSSSSSTLVYASHAMLNLAVHERVVLPNGRIESIWHVHETLRTRICDDELVVSSSSSSTKRVITALTAMESRSTTAGRCPTISCLACGFSDGTIVLWKRGCDSEWKEFRLDIDMRHSITVLDGIFLLDSDDHILLVVGCSAGAFCYTCRLSFVDDDDDDHPNKHKHAATILSSHVLLETSAMNAVYIHAPAEEDCPILMLIGTAAPRHNKIHVYYQTADTNMNAKHSPPPPPPPPRPHYAGSLTGHENWITCMDWKSCKGNNSALLASGSQDAKIRLWNFTTTTMILWSEDHQEEDLAQEKADTDTDQVVDNDSVDDDDDDLHNDEQEQDEEGEARLEIISGKSRTVVTLEALLLGHEASVTSVSWHPHPQPIYGQQQDSLLISSSMDRSILLWSPSIEDGIWTPLTRVGSAGGILGGPIGSSLLGYCRAALEPKTGRYLIGHAYGGALHVWTLEDEALQEMEAQALAGMSTEERASLVKWKATPSLTGHFDGVTDLCWEASQGAYLLTTSNDQTCRLWAPVGADCEQCWLEMIRPQVHGYDLSAVASISTPEHPHFLVTGANEKELRAFDAPLTALRIMKAAGVIDDINDGVERVERAYIPSLGLTNKATAADSAEQEEAEGDNRDHQSLQGDTLGKNGLLLERDLGAMSIWPEVRKLFGHNSELYCLASTLAARTAGLAYTPAKTCFLDNVLVASSAKARNVESAAIRLWDVEKGKCVQVLSGGHKSTVATLGFSPDGRYLASSGKDRRLCIWRRDESSGQFALAWARDSAHKRIVWSVHFCPFDESLLASGSRDGCVKLWKIEESSESGTVQALEICSFAPSFRYNGKPDSVTALSLAPRPVGDKTDLLALGLESGHLELWEVPRSVSGEEVPRPYLHVPASLCHIATVTKLAWRPCQDASKASRHFLASSSMDCGCRLFQITLK